MSLTGAQIVQAAEKYTGVPYYEGNPQGVPPAAKGMDCSGIVQRAMADLGVKIARTTSGQLADANAHVVGTNIGTDITKAQQGDVLHYTGHEEIYIAGGATALVFSEATNGTKAAVRGRTPWPIIGIVRYADAGPGDGTIKVQDANPLDASVNSVVDSFNALTGILKFITDPKQWWRIALSFFGAVLLMVALWRLTDGKAGKVVGSVNSTATKIAGKVA